MAQHSNRLAYETSPYLLQHAHNPVDWYPWGEEAFGRARSENKPILLSIGYSACHWCHVMERESFENQEIAALMNEHYISIKVDREERPDLDQIYQGVCQLVTGQGGWPLTVFLTPDLKPFWVGTYFPPERRFGRPGFPDVLVNVSRTFQGEPEKIQDATAEIGSALKDIHRPHGGDESLAEDLPARAARAMAGAFDRANGGFGSQPKFPNTMVLDLLLRHWRRTGDPEYLDMVRLALQKMAAGGIYDQLGGGFHRYSTDARWLAPHFEKMLYDNALLARLYLDAWQATGDPLFERVARETLAYIQREMTSPEGAFYCTQDADSEGEEGRFFVWSPDEIRALLDSRQADLFLEFFGVTDKGNFEQGRSVLSVVCTEQKLAGKYGLTDLEVADLIQDARARLFLAREKRVRPFQDDKVLAGWNGLMVGACARAGIILNDQKYVQMALRALRFVRDCLFEDGRLKRSFRAGQSGGDGFLEDYAFVIAAALDVFEASGDPTWAAWAGELAGTMDALFRDPLTDDLFLTPTGASNLIVRPRQGTDQSTPAGAAVAARDFLRLAGIMDRPEFLGRVGRILAANAAEIATNPHGAATFLCVLDAWSHGLTEVVVLSNPNDERTHLEVQSLYRMADADFAVFVAAPGSDAAAIFRGKEALDGEMTGYVCRQFQCSPPVNSWNALRDLLDGQH